MKSWQPLCGSDGRTYNNLCDFEGAVCANKNLFLKHRGQCSDMMNDFGGRVILPKNCPKCPLIQDRMYRPVCGTDGKTYERMCELERVICETDGEVEFAREGACMLNDGMMGGYMWGGLPTWGRFDEFQEEEVETCENLDCEGARNVAVCGNYQGVTQVYVNECTMKSMSCELTGNLNSISKQGKPKRGKCKQKKPSFQMFGGRFPVFGGRFGRDAEVRSISSNLAKFTQTRQQLCLV